MGSFSKEIDLFNLKFQKRFRATARGAVQATVSQAQRVRGTGGRMRVDTGFLRASIQGSTDGMPSGPVGNPTRTPYGPQAQVAGTPLVQVLLQWHPEHQEPLFIGWTANYARPREYHDGFMRGAVEKWDTHVKVAARRAQSIG